MAALFAHTTQLVKLGIQGLGIVDIGFLSDFVALEVLHLTGNAIVDIAPLVANAGLGGGDEVQVDENLLDLSMDSPAMAAIAELEGRGVDVEYEPQRIE